jgi:hypothetical protein
MPGSGLRDGRIRTATDLVRYEMLGMCKIAAIIQLGHHLFTSGRASDKRFEAWGAVIPKFVKAAAHRA